MNQLLRTAAGATALLCAMASGTADAATARRGAFVSATGACQAALPVFEGNIRKRPTGVANEGSSNAFVSCSVTTPGQDDSASIDSMLLRLYNRTAAPIEVTCSFVHGFVMGETRIVPRTISIPANDIANLSWSKTDVGQLASISFGNFSCNLLPGTDINSIQYVYSYEIGS